MTQSGRSLIYVNFSPYENTGKILDYLKLRYQTVYSFSFSFHRLAKKYTPSTLSVFQNGRLVRSRTLLQIPTPPKLLFLFLPLRSLILLLQLIQHSFCIRRNHSDPPDFFTVNAFTAWCGMILKRLGLVARVTFWVWDYYPPKDKSKIVMAVRQVYWHFDKIATRADRTVYLNRKLITLRHGIGILPHTDYPIVGIGANLIKTGKRITACHSRLAFIGVLKKSQGLDLILDNAPTIKTAFPSITVDVIGAGPDEAYYRQKAYDCVIPIRFHGLMEIGSPEAKRILSSCGIGIATYIPEEGNVSYFGDPSKIKNYLSYGLPVITTDVFEFSSEIRSSKAGKVITYDAEVLIDAIRDIRRHYAAYGKAARLLALKYDYARIYRNLV